MKSPGQRALELLHDDIVEGLSLGNLVLDHYYSRSSFSDVAYSDVLSLECPRERKELFIDEVKRSGDVTVFIESLEYQNTHSQLASRIRTQIEELEREGESRVCVLPAQPSRTFTKCGKMRRLIRINFRLREITSRGRDGYPQFKQTVITLRNNHQSDHDFLFHMYDAEVAFLRVFYQDSPDQEALLNQMELLITDTKHPVSSRMVYLARKGSLLAMRGDLETGIKYIEKAKTLADTLHPYKDTGMVRYVAVNLLLQKYQLDPDSATKKHIIHDILHSIECDFADEDERVKQDYTKMMYLKLAFCYLGISCFCDLITDCPVEETDCRKAEDCLNKVEGLPGELYNRHLMFYKFASSVLAFRRGDTNLAMVSGQEAMTTAEDSKYSKELFMIKKYMGRFTALHNGGYWCFVLFIIGFLLLVVLLTLTYLECECVFVFTSIDSRLLQIEIT